MFGNFKNQMGRGTKTGEPQTETVLDTGQIQGSVADGARTQQRGCLGIRKLHGDFVGEFFGNLGVLGISAVNIPAGSRKLLTQIFMPGLAMNAGSAGRMYPGNTHPVSNLKTACIGTSFDYLTDRLVTQNDGQMRRRGPAFDFI
jgi:hypothetical protein